MEPIRSIMDDECEARAEDGVFFRDGSVVLFEGSLDEGYRESGRTTVQTLQTSDSDGWTTLYLMMQTEDAVGVAFGGESSWGGAGFFAYRTSAGFEWILHLSSMNNPVSVSIEDEVVVGRVDSPYPRGSEFRIPIAAPHQFTARTICDED